MIQLSPEDSPLRRLGVVDLAVLAAVLAGIYALVTVAREWAGHLQPLAEIHLEARYLPGYLLYSLTRGLLAYGISFIFTLVYGYIMARVIGAERLLLPVLDILQSIPVLGFLPGLVLGLVHLFPQRNFGLELASVLMIFTGQVWNMTFSFHRSLKAVPPDLVIVARLTHLTRWQRFLHLDLSYAATGLVWNSMMSMAGGWFFLTVSEAFVLGKHDFRLPGLGSYMSVAIERGDGLAQVLGVFTMAVMIVLLDQLVWRPLLNWSHKFSDEENPVAPGWWLGSWFWRSRLLHGSFARVRQWFRRSAPRPPVPETRVERPFPQWPLWLGRWLLLAGLAVGIGYAVIQFTRLVLELNRDDWFLIFGGTALTFGRVLAAIVLASLWTIPAGVWIGRHPRWSQRLQPIIQMVASFPAPMVFPVVVGFVLALGGGLGGGSILLLMLGTQWYILFNVIAGSSAIPRELWEVTRLMKLSRTQQWRRLILPAIFPSLLTGWITAMGGAWNASIVAEFMKYQNRTLLTPGLGSLISQATEEGRFNLLAAAVATMAVTVVAFNRLVWKPLGRLAEVRYSLET